MVRLPQGDGVALGVVDDSEETHSPTTRIVLAFLTSVVIEFGVAISVSVRKICEIPKKIVKSKYYYYLPGDCLTQVQDFGFLNLGNHQIL